MFTQEFGRFVCEGDTITCEVDGFDITATVYHDDDNDRKPWDDDGHGPVSDWTRRAKRPGERILSTDGRSHRFYDFAEAVKMARAEKWDAEPYGTGTPGEQAVRAAEADYRNIKAWCDNEWTYCGVAVVVSKDDMDLTDKYDHALWGIECNYPGTRNEYLAEVANELLDEALDAAREKLKALCDCD